MPPILANITLGQVAAVVAVIGLVVLFITRKVWPLMRGVTHLVDDLVGEPERDGVPARPGVMASLAILRASDDEHTESLGQLTERLAAVDERLAAVEHELHPNSGASLRDAVDRIERQKPSKRNKR